MRTRPWYVDEGAGMRIRGYVRRTPFWRDKLCKRRIVVFHVSVFVIVVVVVVALAVACVRACTRRARANIFGGAISGPLSGAEVTTRGVKYVGLVGERRADAA